MSIFHPTTDEDARERKLPSWAQDTITRLRTYANTREVEISRLRDVVTSLEAQIEVAAEANTGPEDSTAWLWREVGGEELPPLGLGADATVDYRPASGIEITVTALGNGIKVTAPLHLMVIPVGRSEFRIQPVSAKIKD